MKKCKRFYITVIGIVIIAVVLLYFHCTGLDCYCPPVDLQGPGLYSFYGHDVRGNRELIHFTRYSREYYIFLVVSPRGEASRIFVDRAAAFSKWDGGDDHIHVIFITTDFAAIPAPYRFSKCLKVAHHDFLQFGEAAPFIIACTGKGQVIYKVNGYREGIFVEAASKVDAARFRSGRPINSL